MALYAFSLPSVLLIFHMNITYYNSISANVSSFKFLFSFFYYFSADCLFIYFFFKSLFHVILPVTFVMS